MIAALLSGTAASPWMRAALRYGAVALAIPMLLLAVRARASGRNLRKAEKILSLRERHLTCVTGIDITGSPSTD
ncbi:hypothetical protein ACMYR2_0217 [Nitrobacter sp. TKz-YC01]